MEVSLSPKEKKALSAYQNQLLKQFPDEVEGLILYGSKARGRGKPYSDLDVAVVVRDDQPPIHQAIVASALEPAVDYNVPLAPMVIERAELDRWTPFTESLIEDGVILWSKHPKKNLLR